MIWYFFFRSEDLSKFLQEKEVLVTQLKSLSRELICVLDKPVNNKIGCSNWLNTRVLKSASRIVELLRGGFSWFGADRSDHVPKHCFDLRLKWHFTVHVYSRVFHKFASVNRFSTTLIDTFKFPGLACLQKIRNFVFNALSCKLIISK